MSKLPSETNVQVHLYRNFLRWKTTFWCTRIQNLSTRVSVHVLKWITRSMCLLYWQPVLLRTLELPQNNWHDHLHLHIWSFFLPSSCLLFLVEAPSLREESTEAKTAQAPVLPVSGSAAVSGVEAPKRAAAGSAPVTKKPSCSTSKRHIFLLICRRTPYLCTLCLQA